MFFKVLKKFVLSLNEHLERPTCHCAFGWFTTANPPRSGHGTFVASFGSSLLSLHIPSSSVLSRTDVWMFHAKLTLPLMRSEVEYTGHALPFAAPFATH